MGSTWRAALAVIVLVVAVAGGAGAGEHRSTGGSPAAPNATGDCAADVATGARDLCAMWVQGHVVGEDDDAVLDAVTFGLRTAEPVRLSPTTAYRFGWVDGRRAADPDDPRGCTYQLGIGLDATGQPEARFWATKHRFEAEDDACGWRGMLFQIVGLLGPDLDVETTGMQVAVDGTTLLVHVPLDGAPAELREVLARGVLHDLTAGTSFDGSARLSVDWLAAGAVDLRP